MSHPSLWESLKPYSRRQLLKWGLAGVGVSSAAVILRTLTNQSTESIRIPPFEEKAVAATGSDFNPMLLVRDFDYGTIKQENGRRIREFQAVADSSTLQLNSAASFVSWNLNGRVPGPTLRATAGDRVRVIFRNQRAIPYPKSA